MLADVIVLLTIVLPIFQFVTSIGELGAGGGSTICLLYALLVEGVFAFAGESEVTNQGVLELTPNNTKDNPSSYIISSMKLSLQGPPFSMDSLTA